MKRGRPVHALGGSPRKDHLFEEKKSLCGKWFYGGGREVEPADVDEDDEDLCNACLRRVEGVEA